MCLWEIGSDTLVPLSESVPNDWEEQAFFVNGRIFFMSTEGLGYQPIGGNGANFWRTLQTELRVMDMDGSHRERVTFIHDPNHADYVPRAADEAVRVFGANLRDLLLAAGRSAADRWTWRRVAGDAVVALAELGPRWPQRLREPDRRVAIAGPFAGSASGIGQYDESVVEAIERRRLVASTTPELSLIHL